MNKILALVLITMVFGCAPKQSPESKVAIANFISTDVSAHFGVILAGEAQGMLDTFPLLLEHWKSIENQYDLPEKRVMRINSALALQQLILLGFEKPPHEMGVSEEEEDRMYKALTVREKEIAIGIDESYWNRIRKRFKERGLQHPDGEKVLSDFEQHHGSPLALAHPQGLAAVVVANAKEFMDLITPLAK